MVRRNVGIIDAYARLSCGLTMIGVGISKKSKSLITLGAMKTAEGITGFCPMYYLLGISTRKSDNLIGSFSRMDSLKSKKRPYDGLF